MIYQKGNKWKITGSSAKFATREKAMEAAGWCLVCENEVCECGDIEEGYTDEEDFTWEFPEDTD